MSTLPRVCPVRGQTYTLRQVFTELELKDDPFLMFVRDGEEEVIQTSVLALDEVLAILDQTLWKYRRTTEEWIPLFYYDGPADGLKVESLVDDYGNTIYVPAGTADRWRA